ncbi:amidohydrolase family protein [Aquisphaera insulae]|uniref:amidohydrolase family protein n=1 Tax=Aquisphaera insulae TaxID=2712864 RepID=UPI0013EA3512|nr:amidohydrolase family protein [Aquisphaera insulae]
MIIDVHAHCWPRADCFSPSFQADARRMRLSPVNLVTEYEAYRDGTGGEDFVALVFGGKARLTGVWIDDQDVADYVARDPDRMIGFMSLDPTQHGWEAEMRDGFERLGLRGIKLLPMYAGFYPQDDRLEPLWKYAAAHRLPVLLHSGTTFVSGAPIDCTLPRHLDAVAIRHPDVKIILAHLGHPYEGETVAVIRKHPNLFADISALFYRPWQLFHSLMLVHEYNVWEKILFGTDFPVTTVAETVAGLRGLGQIRIDRFRLPAEEIERIIHRDALTLLGLARPGPAARKGGPA